MSLLKKGWFEIFFVQKWDETIENDLESHSFPMETQKITIEVGEIS